MMNKILTYIFILILSSQAIYAAGTTCETAQDLGVDPANRIGLTGALAQAKTGYQSEDWYRFEATQADEDNNISFTVKNIEETYNLKFIVKEWDSSSCSTVRLLQSTDFVGNYNAVLSGVVQGKVYAVQIEATSGDDNIINYTLDFSSEILFQPIGQYKFDDCNLSFGVKDNVGTNDGTNFGVEQALGKLCLAGEFQAVESDEVNFGDVYDVLAGDGFTISAWISWDGVVGENTILDKALQYSLKIDSNGYIVFKTSQTGIFIGGTSFAVPVRQWVHVALTYDGAQTYKLYRSGVEVLTYVAPSGTPVSGTGIVTLGAANSGVSPDRFSGDMDEVNFYDRALSSFAITKLVNEDRLCPCCPAPIEIVGGFVTISDTYDASAPPWDRVTYVNGFTFRQPPIVFILASNDGGHSADMRIRNITRSGFEVANIEPQGEDGPHIGMNLSYFAISRGKHDLGDQTVEACSYMTQTVQFNKAKVDANPALSTGDIDTNNYGWDPIALDQTYLNPEGPAVVAQILTANNEQRLNPREVSRPWINVAIENNSTGVFMALERGETALEPITYPEEIAYMVAEGNIQSTFIDDTGTTIAWETIVVGPTFQGTDKAGNLDQRFNFQNTNYSLLYGCDESAAADEPNASPPSVNLTLPLVAANLNSRNADDGGWIRRNDLTCTYLEASVWEDRIGSWTSSSSYSTDGLDVPPSDLQDTERTHDEREKGSVFVYANAFSFAAPFEPEPGAFNAIEVGNLDSTDISTKVVNKDFSLDIISIEAASRTYEAYYGPVRASVVESSTCTAPAPILVDSLGIVTFDNVGAVGTIRQTLSNVNSTKITRNGALRMEYLDDGSGKKVDFENCYTLGDFATYCAPIASAALCDTPTQCNSVDAMKGIGVNGPACQTCLFDNFSAVGSVCATNDFAVRPDHYALLVDGQDDSTPIIIKSQDYFTLTATAVNLEKSIAMSLPDPYPSTLNYNQTLNQIYAPVLPPSADSFEIIAVDNTPCAPGEIRKDRSTVITGVPGLGFVDGDFNTTNIDYTEVGDIQLRIQEIESNAYAYVDLDDTNPAYDSNTTLITPADINVSFTPDYFTVDMNLSDFNMNVSDQNFTYFSNDSTQMAANLDVTVTAFGINDEKTENYTATCHSQDTDLTIEFDALNQAGLVPTPLVLQWSQDSNLSHDNNVSYTFPATLNINAATFVYDIFASDFTLGSHIDRVNLAISRTVNEPTNPVRMTITDGVALDANGITGNYLGADEVATYYFGRLYAPRYRINGAVGTVNMFYETFCDTRAAAVAPSGTTCTPATFWNSPMLSPDEVSWYDNTALHQVADGNITATGPENIAFNGDFNAPVIAADSKSVTYSYAGTDYPYKRTMRLDTANWLVFDPFNPAQTYNTFELEFHSAQGQWAGVDGSASNVDMNASATTNRRIDW